MILFANLLQGIGVVLDMVLGVMIFVLIARAVISWVNPDPYNPIVRFLTASTEPLLKPLRRFIPLIGGGIDITPIVLLVVFYFLKVFLVQTLLDYSVQMKHGLGAGVLSTGIHQTERQARAA